MSIQKTSIEFGTVATLSHIAENLRREDFAEIAAMSAARDPSMFLAAKIMGNASEVYVARRENPIAAWGYVELWPRVASCFAFGTNDWGLVVGAVTRHVRRYMFPRVIAAGYHRMECRALACREDVARWVSLLGGEPEAVLRKAGKDGEDFIIYRWIKR
jgi:hypothetical protein